MPYFCFLPFLIVMSYNFKFNLTKFNFQCSVIIIHLGPQAFLFGHAAPREMGRTTPLVFIYVILNENWEGS